MENQEQIDNQQEKKTPSFKRKVLYALTSFIALGLTGAGYISYKIQNYGKESTAIGKAVGDYVTKVQAERKKLNAITQRASHNRAAYKVECTDMLNIIAHLIRNYPQQSPQEIIEEGCKRFAKHHQNNPKADIILEDMRSIQKYSAGTGKDLHAIMCYYPESPEVPFQNRFSEPSDVRESIYQYELKARRYFYDNYNIRKSSVFDMSRQNF